MDDNNKKPLLSVRDLVVEYGSGEDVTHAVNRVSFSLARGEVLGLVGETGAGKTTLAKSLVRLLPKPAASIRGGEIEFDGRDILKMSDAELQHLRGARISVVFADPVSALNPTRTIGSQIAEVLALHQHLPRHIAADRAAEMLERVGISADRAGEYPYQFSTGMRQRVVIAIALACSPDLLVADEPTTNLDVTIQAQVLDMIQSLREEKDMAMLLITHDLGIVAENCDSVAVMYAGEIIEYGSIEEIFEHAAHPYTLGLFAAMPDMSMEFERLSPIPGCSADLSALPTGCKFRARCPYATADCRREDVADTLRHLGGTHYCRCGHVGGEGGGA